MFDKDGKKKFIEGFTGQTESQPKKKKKSFQERHKERMAAMSPEEKAERQEKIDAQSNEYEDGGVAKKKSYFSKLKDMCKKK